MKKFLILTFFFSIIFKGIAQQDFTTYYMDGIAQSSYSNLTNSFNGKMHIGLPGLSSTYLMYSNSSFSWSDIIEKRNDSLILGFPRLVDNLLKNNYMSFIAQNDLLSFGLKIGKRSTLLLNVTEKVSLKFLYPRDIIQFIDKGNSGFSDNTANFEGLGINFTHYREYGIGLNRSFLDKRLILGARAKYLYGMENIDSKKTEISIFTDPNTYEINAKGNIQYNTSGLNDSISTISNYLLAKNNHGFGLDLSGSYQVTDKVNINASVLDIGFISWKNDVKNYVNKGGEFNFNGIDIDEFILNEIDSSGNTSFDRVIDSLSNAFELTEEKESYLSTLTSRIYLGATYKLSEKGTAGGLLQTEFFKSKINPSITLSYQHKFSNLFHASASYTIINSSYNNLGGGFIFHPGPVQLYVMADNILGAFQPQNIRHMQIRAGINLVLGKNNHEGAISKKEHRRAKKTKEETKEI